MHKNIDVHYYFKTISDQVEESIKTYVEENINKKMDAYFKTVLHHEDARITLRVTMERHKGEDERYDGTFLFTLNGKAYPPYKRDGDRAFENVHDLVNHAFDHLKEQLASEKDVSPAIKKDKTQKVEAVIG